MSTAKKAAKMKPQLGNTRMLPAGTKLERHWLSTSFPDASEGQAENLRNSLRTHGQQNPIVLLDNKVIDGGRRLAQLTGLNQPLLVADYVGDDAAGFVYVQNLCQKDLTKLERLMATARLTNLKQGRPKAGTKQVNLSLSLEEAVRLSGSSESTIKSAKKVLDSKNSGLIQAVESGKISVDMGVKLIEKSKDQIEKVLASKSPKKAYNELFPPSGKEASKQEDSSDTDSAAKGNAAEEQDKPSPEKESETGTPAAESTKESDAVPAPPQAPTVPNPSESTAVDAPAEHNDADSLFAYVQSKLQKFQYEERDQFWGLVWDAFKQEVQRIPLENKTEEKVSGGDDIESPDDDEDESESEENDDESDTEESNEDEEDEDFDSDLDNEEEEEEEEEEAQED